MLKQPQYQPMPMEEQVVSIYSCTPKEGRPSWVRHYPVADIRRYEREMLEYVRTRHGDVLKAIRDSGRLEPETERQLSAALDEFAKLFQPSGSA
jgi:F-type H+-transporting ATPase subunit alpha